MQASGIAGVACPRCTFVQSTFYLVPGRTRPCAGSVILEQIDATKKGKRLFLYRFRGTCHVQRPALYLARATGPSKRQKPKRTRGNPSKTKALEFSEQIACAGINECWKSFGSILFALGGSRIFQESFWSFKGRTFFFFVAYVAYVDQARTGRKKGGMS